MKFLIIIPAHNEAEFIGGTLKSLSEQTHQDFTLVVVNDNSTDATEAIVNQYTKTQNNFEQVLHQSSDQHEPGSKIIQAFNVGLALKNIEDFDVVCKFDADLVFPDNYLTILSQAFSTHQNLGIYGGFCTVKQNNKWVIENLTGQKHVRGALKAYSVQCFQKIGGLIPEMGWDTIDELLAQYYGFEVKTNLNLHVKHLKPTGQRYSDTLAQKFGISLHQIRYDIGLAFLTCTKMALKKKNTSFLWCAMSYFFKAKTKKIPYLVDAKQGKFIRNLRWKGVLEKFNLKPH